MANYTKLTDFASKDSLPTGSPAKIVKGTEIDDEFQSIENAIASKSDTTYVDSQINSLDSQINAINLSSVWPVGSVYINASTTTNPATLLGFGTWVEIGQGRVLVGQNTSDASFNSMGETGGSKNAVVVSHTHSASTSTAGEHSHTLSATDSTGSTWAPEKGSGGNYPVTTSTAGAHSHSVTVNSTGESGVNKNLQPYLVVKMWKRTA